jgi:uncharacterized repeat protein (TIGR02543 family)
MAAAGFDLSVSRAGTGTGTVTSSPTGINCGADCTETYGAGTSVTLTATPNAGSVFAGWSGACTGSGSCIVSMTAARSVTATFNVSPTNFTLSVSKNGTASGTVTSSPTGINCGFSCNANFASGTSVTLTAVAASGANFAGWSGACTGTGACVVAMTAARSVTATFNTGTPAPTLTVAKAGTGSGTVTSSPAGINCGSDCTETYASGTSVSLTATAAGGSVFAGWSGACTGTGPCTVSMTAARSVTATFNTVGGGFALTVGKAGTGSGTVTSSPSGIDCGADCTETYASGSSVTLTAAAASGSSFVGWSGACTGTSSCVVSMTAARAVTASFDLTTPPGITLAEAVDNPSLAWSTSGNAAWFGQSSVSYFGGDAAQSGTVADGQSSTIETAVVGPGTLSYRWKVSSEVGFDFLQFYFNGVLQAGSISGEVDWAQQSWALPAGNHVLRWTYIKDSSASAGSDAGWLDQVVYTASGGSFLLSVSKSGSGTVVSSPAGINCGFDCTENYPNGTNVSLTASPASGYVFAGWSGACTGTGTCTVSMTAARSVTATFTSGSSAYTMTVTRAGSAAGTGLVTSSPAGINCGSDCTESYASGTSVTLTAVAPGGSVFAGWSGACTGTGSCTLSMTAARNVTATFNATAFALTVTKAGTGTGTVTSSPVGVDCGADCSETYASGTTVTLTAVPAGGSVFAGWSGACTGTGSCTVSMTAARSVTAAFNTVGGGFALTVGKAGTGSGTVTSSPSGINCGADCSETYASGSSVTLTAAAASGSSFAGWSGACTGTGACTVSMTAARNVTATFNVSGNSSYLLSVNKTGSSGSGTIVSSGAGINCGFDCSENYASGTLVTLSSSPASGSVFSGWKGACAGSESTCTVTMAQAQTVTAIFDLLVTSSTVALGTALDSPSLSWTSSGWLGQNKVHVVGGSATQSNLVTDSQGTWVQTTITGPGTLSFRWRVSSEFDFDFLSFYFDDFLQTGQISGFQDWIQQIWTVPQTGVHTLRWLYSKDSSVSHGADRAWLDQVQFVPGVVVPVAPSGESRTVVVPGR